MQRTELENYLNSYLDTAGFRDYCPNGLQVEGRSEIRTLVTGVTASLSLLRSALERGADAVVVHHGYFWRSEDARVIGARRERLALLLNNELNLFAFHLPLDVHPEIGNNVQLARLLELPFGGRFGDQNVGFHGRFDAAVTLGESGARIATRLERVPLVIGESSKSIRRIAWCTGAAQSMLEGAVQLGVDAFISGEISEPTVHLAREAEVAYIAAGHHATERYGVRALGEHLAAKFGLTHHFVDIPNPV